MKLTVRIAALICCFLLGTLSCVSVNLGDHTAKRAKGVSVSPPGQPFSAQAREDVDAAWKNNKNGNLISYLSDCQDETDPSLDNIVEGALAGLSGLHLESTQNPTILGREGRRVAATGKVDGVPTQIDLLAFKRNRCIYLLSYVGVERSFALDHAHFDTFIQGFRAP